MTLPVGAIGEALAQVARTGTVGETLPGAGGMPPGSAATAGGAAGIEGTTGIEGAGSVGGAGSGFGQALTQAISSLEQTQQQASGAAQALATGTAANPESAVMTVADAQLQMQLASQIRTKAVEGLQQIFQTQV